MQGMVLWVHVLAWLSLATGGVNGCSGGGYSSVGETERFRPTLQESSRCGAYIVEWSNPADGQDSPGEARLVVRTSGGEEIFEFVTEAWRPYTFDVLWCEDILENGLPALAFTTYSGGVHCCWDAVVVSIERPPRWLLRAGLGNYYDVSPEQLDGTGPLELVTRSDLFFAFDGLPLFAAPFLPLVFAYDGQHYVEATRRFPSHIRRDLEQGLQDLSGSSLDERTGKALRVLGDLILLGEEEQGLADLKARVSDDVASWLDKHAREAVARVRPRYN